MGKRIVPALEIDSCLDCPNFSVDPRVKNRCRLVFDSGSWPEYQHIQSLYGFRYKGIPVKCPLEKVEETPRN